MEYVTNLLSLWSNLVQDLHDFVDLSCQWVHARTEQTVQLCILYTSVKRVYLCDCHYMLWADYNHAFLSYVLVWWITGTETPTADFRHIFEIFLIDP
jgi:hypothetical protein